MKKQLLMGALCALLSTAVCTPASVLVTSASARQGAARVYKFIDGGIQFTVPAGWDAKADKDSVKVLPKSGSAQIAFVALPIPTNLDKDERASLFDSLSGKAGNSLSALQDAPDEDVGLETLLPVNRATEISVDCLLPGTRRQSPARK